MARYDRLLNDLSSNVITYLLKYWIGLDGIGSSISDAIADHFADNIWPETEFEDAKSLGRNIEQISDSLFSVFKSNLRFSDFQERETDRYCRVEGKTRGELNEIDRARIEQSAKGEFEALIYAVEYALMTNKISPTDFVSSRFEPRHLEKILLKSTDSVTLGLSEYATGVFTKSIRDCAEFLATCALRLPELNSLSVIDAIKVSEATLTLVQQIQENIERLSAPAGSDNYDEFLSRVRLNIARHFKWVEVFGWDIHSSLQKYDLDISFTQLTTTNRGVDGATANDVEFDYAISSGSRFLIRGEAGTGKTTLLRWLALKCATGALPNQLYHLADKVPVFIRLRSDGLLELKSGEVFEFCAGTLKPFLEETWNGRALEEGRFLFLLDGVDEVKHELRGEVLAWINSVVTNYPKNFFIVTSRPSAVEANWLSDLSFAELNVIPMTRAKSEIFIERWHAAISSNPNTGLSRLALEAHQRALMKLLERSTVIRSMASYPVLAAMLCSLNLQRKGIVPQARMEFYRVAIDALLSRRDAERGLDASDQTGLSAEQKWQIVQAIAHWFFENGISEASFEEVERCVDRTRRFLTRMRVSNAEIMKYLIERSGILREPEDDKIDFVHRTIQEYLAAREMIGQDLIGRLVKDAHIDSMRDLFVFAVGHCQPGHREQLLRNLVSRASSDDRHARPLSYLSSASLEVCDRLAPKVQSLVVSCVSDVYPPRSIYEARELSHAVEIDISVIGDTNDLFDEDMPWVLSCLNYSDHPDSFDLFKKLARRASEECTSHLIRAMEHNAPEEYVRSILPHLHFDGDLIVEGNRFRFVDQSRKLDLTVRVSGAAVFDGISHLKGLRSLSVLEADELKGTLDLSTLPNIEEVSVMFCGNLESLGAIISSESVRSVRFGGCDQLSLDFLAVERPIGFENVRVESSDAANVFEMKYVNKNSNVETADLVFGSS